MAELLNRNVARGFSFGLIEVALYGFDDGTLGVQPRVVAKTQLIEGVNTVHGLEKMGTILVLLGRSQNSRMKKPSRDGRQKP